MKTKIKQLFYGTMVTAAIGLAPNTYALTSTIISYDVYLGAQRLTSLQTNTPKIDWKDYTNFSIYQIKEDLLRICEEDNKVLGVFLPSYASFSIALEDICEKFTNLTKVYWVNNIDESHDLQAEEEFEQDCTENEFNSPTFESDPSYTTPTRPLQTTPTRPLQTTPTRETNSDDDEEYMEDEVEIDQYTTPVTINVQKPPRQEKLYTIARLRQKSNTSTSRQLFF